MSEVLVNNQDTAPTLTQRWREYAPYNFILFSLVILIPHTLRGTSSSFRYDCDTTKMTIYTQLKIIAFTEMTSILEPHSE